MRRAAVQCWMCVTVAAGLGDVVVGGDFVDMLRRGGCGGFVNLRGRFAGGGVGGSDDDEVASSEELLDR